MLSLLKHILLKILFFMKNTAIWWSYHIPLNYVWTLSLCFCYCQKNLMKTWIKVASGNGGLSEQLLFIMWSFDQQYIFLCKNTRQNFFCWAFLQFSAFLLMFVTILARDHRENWLYFKYAYLKEHNSAFEKFVIWAASHTASETLSL